MTWCFPYATVNYASLTFMGTARDITLTPYMDIHFNVNDITVLCLVNNAIVMYDESVLPVLLISL